MEILLAIDKFLQTALVRWFLLISTVALLIAGIAYKARLGICELQLKAAKGDIATYAAHVEYQNLSIIKAGADYEQAKKKALVANQKAADLAKELQRMGQIIIAPAVCEDMVSQAIREVRR